MNGHNVIGVYALRADAERARDRLIEFGIPAADIRMSAADGIGGTAPAAATAAPMPQRRESFWDWLFGTNLPASDRTWYEENLREGRTVLSVLVRDETRHDRVEQIMDEFGAVEHEASVGASHHAAGGVAPGYLPGSDQVRASEPPMADRPAAAGRAARVEKEGEQVIPLVKEEFAVGKRVSERRYRIHTYVVETPVEEQVHLRDERVIVERRPASGEVRAGESEIPRERDYEIVERHEEPVVDKRVRNVEDIVVRKEADERTETVRGTVRETKVDVENEEDGREAAVEQTGAPKRRP